MSLFAQIGEQEKAQAGVSSGDLSTALQNAKRMISISPAARAANLASAINVASSILLVGEFIHTKEYSPDTGIGGNDYQLLDAGNSSSRPAPDGGRIVHVGSNGLYLQGVFPNGVWIEQFGAKPVSGFDNADAIEKAAAYRKCGKLNYGFGAFEIGRTVFLPIGIDMPGLSGNRGFDDTYDYASAFLSMAGGTYVEDFLFFCNINPNGDTETWVEAYPNNDSGSFSNVTFDGTATNGINGVKFAGSYKFENITAKKVGSLTRKPNLYTDSVKIKNIHAIRRSNQTDYLIDLPGLGDGYIIENVASGYLNADHTGTTNGVHVGACRGGQLVNVINGNHLINGAKSFEIYGMHIEGGEVRIRDSNVHIHDGIMFCEEDVDGQIVLESVDGVYNNRYEVTVSNVVFDQSMNRRGGLQQSARPDIVVNPHFTVNINDCKRKVTDSSVISVQQYYGILVGTDEATLLPAFNNYSHVLSKRCVITNNRPFIDGVIPAQPDSFNGLTAQTVAIEGATFTATTATYYYQAQILQDPVRLNGRNAVNSEVSLSLSNGGDIAELTIDWGLVANRSKFMMRLYRGNSPGSYDKFVDIPISSARKFYDVGHNISGFVWSSRTASGVDSINSGLTGASSLEDGVVRARTVGAKPTVGAWKTGDVVVKTNPVVANTGDYINHQFTRLTDGSNHTKNVDWLVLASVQG